MEQILSAFYVFLGAFFAFTFSLIVEYFKDRQEQKQLKKNFIFLAKAELGNLIRLFERLQMAFEDKSQQFDQGYLTHVLRNMKTLEQNRKDSIFLKNPELQEKFLQLASDISLLINELSILESAYLSLRNDIIQNKTSPGLPAPIPQDKLPELDSITSSKRASKLVVLIDLKRRIEEFIKLIENESRN